MPTTIKIQEKPLNNRYSLFKPYWRQGEFYFNNSKRVAIVTDVKFLKNDSLLVAHREAAKIYVVRINDEGYEVVSEQTLQVRNLPSFKRFFHPDLVAIHDNSLFITDFSNGIACYELSGDQLIFKKVMKVPGNSYHGCFVSGDTLYLGAIHAGKVVEINLNDGSFNELGFDPGSGPFNAPDLRIKALGKNKDYLILGMDLQRGDAHFPNNGGDSWIGLFHTNGNQMKCLSHLKFENTQLDGHASNHEHHFFTIHNGNTEKGKIAVVKVEDGQIYLVNEFACESFPHGIDVNENSLAYTSYAQNAVYIHDLNEVQ